MCPVPGWDFLTTSQVLEQVERRNFHVAVQNLATASATVSKIKLSSFKIAFLKLGS